MLCILIAGLLSACGPTPEEIAATEDQIKQNIYDTQTAVAPTATNTPTFTPTATVTPTSTPNPTATTAPTATEAPCGHVNLTGHYVDFRNWGGAIYGWIMDAVQEGCDFTGMESFFLRAAGPGSVSQAVELTGTIDGERVRVCYTASGYCLNLVILDGGDTLVNGVEGWQYEKTEE